MRDSPPDSPSGSTPDSTLCLFMICLLFKWSEYKGLQVHLEMYITERKTTACI